MASESDGDAFEYGLRYSNIKKMLDFQTDKLRKDIALLAAHPENGEHWRTSMKVEGDMTRTLINLLYEEGMRILDKYDPKEKINLGIIKDIFDRNYESLMRALGGKENGR